MHTLTHTQVEQCSKEDSEHWCNSLNLQTTAPPPHKTMNIEHISSKKRRLNLRAKSQSKHPEYWIQNNLYCLTRTDSAILLSTAGWMNSSLVSAAQKLLKKIVPHQGGFQETSLGTTCGFAIEASEFTQVLHNGSDHWLTISTVGAREAEVFVFDSLYKSVSQSVKNQIAALLSTTAKSIQLNFISVQKQLGGCDCGLFALAYATSLVTGHNPARHVYAQNKMRKHLYNCLKSGEMEMFPLLKDCEQPTIACADSIDVYCTCRMPEIDGIDMVECSKCNEWYHVCCIDVPKQVMEDSCLQWFCHLCIR